MLLCPPFTEQAANDYIDEAVQVVEQTVADQRSRRLLQCRWLVYATVCIAIVAGITVMIYKLKVGPG